MQTLKTLSLLLVCSILLFACDNKSDTDSIPNTTADPQVRAIEKFLENDPHSASNSPFNDALSGELIETVNANKFTFVKIKTLNGEVWAAGPMIEVKVGDQLSFDGKTPMKSFYSKSLNKTFDIIYFVNSFTINGSAAESSFEDSPAK